MFSLTKALHADIIVVVYVMTFCGKNQRASIETNCDSFNNKCVGSHLVATHCSHRKQLVMTSCTLEQVKKGKAGPFSGLLRARVVLAKDPYTYTMDGASRQCLTVGLADTTAALKAVVYDNSQFSRYKAGGSVAIRNVIIRADGTLVITKNSRSFTTSNIEVTPEMEACVRKIVEPPPADVVTLQQGLCSPQKTVVSIKGHIIQEDQEREVQVRNKPTRVKDIYLTDTTKDKVKVTLWRDQCSSPCRTGDFVLITDVVTSTHKGEASFSLSTKSSIETTDAPLEVSNIVIEGFGGADDQRELLTDDGTIVPVETLILLEGIPAEDDLEEFISSRLPLSAQVTRRGSTVEQIEFL